MFNTQTLIQNKIAKELQYLGYDLSHKGTQYLINAIEYVVSKPHNDLGILAKDVYPEIALMHNDSIHNIKCRINAATDIMYCNCELNKLKNYFYFDIDAKPKTKTIINTIINRLKL